MNPLSAKHPVWALGFRPLYFVAALWFIVSLFIWLSAYAHGLPINSHLNPVDWHAHEMLFGFTGAVIVGFLFTAVRNWTALDTPRGMFLQFVLLCWLLTRVLNLTGASWLALIAEALFFISAALGVAKPLLARQSQRNYLFIAALMMLALLSSLHHLSAMQMINWMSAAALLQAALAVIVIVVTIMAGRVIPMFTKNPLPEVSIKQWAWLEKSIIPITVLWLIAELIQLNIVRFALAAMLTVMHAIRLSGWGGIKTFKVPMLWILHGAYAWLVVGFFLRFLGFISPLPLLLSTHALTTGTIACLCLGMMARTARGHTGRLISASKIEVTAFALMLLAALFRVIFPLLSPTNYHIFVALAGVFAMLAFGFYLYRFSPWLFSVRADGRPD